MDPLDHDTYFVTDVMLSVFHKLGLSKSFPAQLEEELLHLGNKYEETGFKFEVTQVVSDYIFYNSHKDLYFNSEEYEYKEEKIIENYAPIDFLKFLGQCSYLCVIEVQRREVSTEVKHKIVHIYLRKMIGLMEKLRKQGILNEASWKELRDAVTALDSIKRGNGYPDTFDEESKMEAASKIKKYGR